MKGTIVRKPPLGELEQELLRRVSERGAPVSVRELTEALREERGLARTTILTVLENLRKKGHLTRDKAEGGVFRYGPAVPKTEMLRGLVRGFVENALGGSISPLVAYLANTDEAISSGDLAELERLVDDLRRARREQKEGEE